MRESDLFWSRTVNKPKVMAMAVVGVVLAGVVSVAAFVVGWAFGQKEALELVRAAAFLPPPVEIVLKDDGVGPAAVSIAEAIRAEFGNRRRAEIASWYGPGFHGRTTANLEIFNQNAWTVASKTLPLGTLVLIESPLSGRSCIARVNDKGPYVDPRTMDVSLAVARYLGMEELGVFPVFATPFGLNDLHSIAVKFGSGHNKFGEE